MLRTLWNFIERVVAPIPGWLLLLAGLALIALAVLVPTWAESREMQWQLGLVREQAKRMEEQQKSYTDFDHALAADDPVLVEKLAFFHLRLKPVNAEPLFSPWNPPMQAPSSAKLVRAGQKPGQVQPVGAPAGNVPSVEQLLHKPMPEPGVDYPEYRPVETRLTRLTSKPATRALMLAAGICCVVGGLLMNPRPQLIRDPSTPIDSEVEIDEPEPVTASPDQPLASAEPAVNQPVTG